MIEKLIYNTTIHLTFDTPSVLAIIEQKLHKLHQSASILSHPSFSTHTVDLIIMSTGPHANGAGSHDYRIASIPADGIGPEVVSAAIEVVEKLAQTLKTFKIEFTHIPWGTAYYKKHGRYVDVNVLETLRKYDAALFGSVGAPGRSSFSL